jgi:hypothetical protein
MKIKHDQMKQMGGDKAMAKCPAKVKDDAKITSIVLLDGDDKTELTANTKQYINLPRDKKWVDGTVVKNIDRLNRFPRIKVKFDKPGEHNFKIKLVPDGNNIVYSVAEKGRNTKFGHISVELPFQTNPNGTKIVSDLYFSSAGKNKFKFEATDSNGNKATSPDLETSRVVYFQKIIMTEIKTKVTTAIDTFKTEFENNGISLIELVDVEMEHLHNIGSTAEQVTFLTKARTAYNSSKGPGKAPYIVAIAYTDQLAVKDSKQKIIKAGVKVGKDQPDVEIPITNVKGEKKSLWRNIVPTEGWYMSCKFLKDKGVAGKDEKKIDLANCSPVPENKGVADPCNKVKIKVSDLPDATGKIILEVNWINRMRGGLSFVGNNLICIASRGWWKDLPAANQNQTMIHELGHKIGMVSDGKGKLPDKCANLYTGKGHVGEHCHQGVPEKDSYAKEKGTCVMFGSSNDKRKPEFCTDCAPAVKKMDISTGWTAF